jgi:hypothetical protein
MAGYTRQSLSSIDTGLVIEATDLNDEYNAIETAFNATSGHNHDGTAANGAPITKVGPTQDVVISTTAVTPKTTNTVDIGAASLKFKDLYLQGSILDADIDLANVTITGSLTEFNTTLQGDSFVSLTGAETLTNKTLTEPNIAVIVNTGDLTLPTSTDTLVGRATTDTLTNKTIDSATNTVTVDLSEATVTGTTAEFNAALSDNDFATLAGTETLTNKTVNLTSNTLTGTVAEFNTALSDGTFATLTGIETLTNKTIDSASNTLTVDLSEATVTGTTAEFNTALSDDDFATLAGTETLTNKTLTSPTVNTGSLTNPTVTNYVETINTSSGATYTVDLANGTLHKFTTTANATITLPASVAGKSFTVIVAYGGAHTLAFSGGTTIKWVNGSQPTATSAGGSFDIFTFIQDGTNTYASVFGQNL